MPVKKGDKVKIEYDGTLDDGTVFDSSEKHGKPMEFEVGAEQVIKGFEDAIIGMEKGEEKEVKIKPGDGYGERDPNLIKKIPKDQFPEDQKVDVGMELIIQLPNGMQVPAKVAEIGDDDVAFDFNHPLAGKNLNFKIKVVEVSD